MCEKMKSRRIPADKQIPPILCPAIVLDAQTLPDPPALTHLRVGLNMALALKLTRDLCCPAAGQFCLLYNRHILPA